MLQINFSPLILESFIEDLLPKNLLLEEVALCQSCLIKFNLYDNYASKALELKNELISSFRSTQDSTEAEILRSDLQLSEVFPEIEFDFGLDEIIASDEGMKSAKAEMQSDLHRINANNVEVKRQKDEIAEAEKKIGPKSVPRSKKLIGSLVCDVCDMTNFKNRRGLIAHLNSHKKSKFYCQLCKMSFKTANSFKVHISSNHGTIVDNIPCPFSSCNKQFSSKIALRAHFICHNKDEKNPSFVCETCGRVAIAGIKKLLNLMLYFRQRIPLQTVVHAASKNTFGSSRQAVRKLWLQSHQLNPPTKTYQGPPHQRKESCLQLLRSRIF